MGLSSLCVLINALSFGAMGFICMKYFVGFCLLLCYIFVLFVEYVFEIILWDLHLIVLFDSLV